MRNPRLKSDDWEEITYALDLKAKEIEKGKYDDEPGEVNSPGSGTSEWAAHLRRIIDKITP
jgi:hypothetical protein